MTSSSLFCVGIYSEGVKDETRKWNDQSVLSAQLSFSFIYLYSTTMVGGKMEDTQGKNFTCVFHELGLFID